MSRSTSENKISPMPSMLAQWLLEAKEKHTAFEKVHGPDPHWENWYALFLRYRLDGLDRDTASGWATLDVLKAPGVK